MPRTEVSWKSENAEGEKRESYAHRVGNKWVFFTRAGRFEDWREDPSPPLEDWLSLLDGVRRRIGRHLARKDDETLVVAKIRELFPGARV